jgi:HK97 family phage prohead protease
MPWSKVTDHEDCDGIAVVKDETGEVEGCHDTEEEANDQIAALEASEDDRAPTNDEPDKQSMTRANVEDLSEGDLLAWDSSGGTAYGQIDTIAMGETVSGSLEPDDTEHETSDDNPGLIIELVEKEDGDVMGTGDTVFHRPGTVSKVSEGDVPERSAGQQTRRTGSYRAVLPDANVRQTADDDTVTVQFMTEQVARDGMVLDADGIDTGAFEKNPVVLWSHGTDPRRGDEPIGKASNLRRNGDGMLADVTFAEDEFAQRIRDKVQDGFVNAVSIGWRTEEVDTDGDAPTVTRSDMTEFSFVAVPADTDALVQERTAGSDIRQQIARLEEEIQQLKERRAQATATSPPESVDQEGTPSASAEQGRDEQPRTSPRMATRQDYERLAGQIVPLIRTELKKQLGKT